MTTFADNFNRADAGSLGNGWSYLVGSSGATIASNEVIFANGSFAALINSAFSASDVDMSMDVYPDNGATEKLLFRVQDANNYYYAIVVKSFSDAYMGINKVIGGVDSGVSTTYVVSGGFSAANTLVTLRVTAVGTSLGLYFAGALQGTVTDSSITASGAFGIGSDGGRADNFSITGTGSASSITAGGTGIIGTIQPVTLTLGSSPGTLALYAGATPVGTLTATGTLGLTPVAHGSLILNGTATFSGSTSSISGPTLTIAGATVNSLTVASDGASLTGVLNTAISTPPTPDDSKITVTGTGTLFFSTVTSVVSGNTITLTPVGGKVLNGQSLTLAFAAGALTLGADASTSFSVTGTGSTFQATITFDATETDETNFNFREAAGVFDNGGVLTIVRAGTVTATLDYNGFTVASGVESILSGVVALFRRLRQRLRRRGKLV